MAAGLKTHFLHHDVSLVGFTAAAAGVRTVALTGTLPTPLFHNASFQHFPEADGVHIAAVGVMLPHSFVLGEGGGVQLQLGYANGDRTTNGTLAEFGNTGNLFIPGFNTMFEIDHFIPYPLAAGGGKWKLELRDIGGEVSMANVPTSPVTFDAVAYKAVTWLQVRHTLDMVL